MPSWMDWFPEYLAAEIEAYAEHGMEVEIDENARTRGILALTVTHKIESEIFCINVDYPSLFPFFQPMAFIKNRQFGRHQHPESGNLCLLGRGTQQWHSDDRFASVIAERLPIILSINSGIENDKIALLEEAQGEPFTEYFNGSGLPGSAIIYDSSWKLDEAIKMGTAKVLLASDDSASSNKPKPLTGYISELRHKGETIASWEGPKFEQFHKSSTIRWIRLDAPPSGSAKQIYDGFSESQRRHLDLDRIGHNQQNSFLIIFREEVEQFVYGDAIACFTIHSKITKNGRERKTISNMYAQRTFRGGTSDLNARMPGLSELSKRSILIVGLGALGAPTAIQCCRAGIGQIDLLDFDYVDPGTVRRWPLGASAFGRLKSDAVAEFVQREYPWTKAVVHRTQIGIISTDEDASNQFESITNILRSADLVIDLTAEFGVNHLMSTLARHMKVPYVVGSATPGAWGGYVASFAYAPSEPCWLCLRHDLYGDDWADDVPASDPEGTFQPPGCPARTFTGTAFDLEEISLEVVRIAVGLLTDGYPSPSHQLEILNLRDDGQRIAPAWKSRDINVQADCPCQT